MSLIVPSLSICCPLLLSRSFSFPLISSRFSFPLLLSSPLLSSSHSISPALILSPHLSSPLFSPHPLLLFYTNSAFIFSYFCTLILYPFLLFFRILSSFFAPTSFPSYSFYLLSSSSYSLFSFIRFFYVLLYIVLLVFFCFFSVCFSRLFSTPFLLSFSFSFPSAPLSSPLLCVIFTV